MRFHLVIGVMLSIAACGDDDAQPDASVMDAGPDMGRDGGPSDAARPDADADASVTPDASADSGAAADLGGSVDAGLIDGGIDGGSSDLGTGTDLGMADLGAPDTGVIDAGSANACADAPVVGSGTYAITVPATSSAPAFAWCAVGEESQVVWLSAVIPARAAIRIDALRAPGAGGDVKAGIRYSCASTTCQGGDTATPSFFHFPASPTPQAVSIPIGGTAGAAFVTITIPDAAPVDTRPAGVAGQVSCGSASCALASQTCCAETQTCGNSTAGVTACGRDKPTLRCDGPEDCSGGQVCCAHQWASGNYASCSTECQEGAQDVLNRRACHNDADCPTGAPYCESSSTDYFNGLPLKYCMRPCMLDLACGSQDCEMRSGRYAGPLC